MTAPVVAPPQQRAPSLVKTGGVGNFVVNPNFVINQKIKVVVRLRPLLIDDETKNKKPRNADKRGWTVKKEGAHDTLIQKGTARKVEGKTVFNFDQVFDEEIKTPLVYKSIARPMVQSVVEGKHATVFAYGQTGSGKTFTMQGDGQKTGGQAGIIQLVASDLFRFTKQGSKTSRDWVVKVSYVEVYNERVRDLLADDIGSAMSHASAEVSRVPEVQIRVGAEGEVVMNCTQQVVMNVDEVVELLIQGNQHRVTARTDANNHSSRSHAIFRLTVESQEKTPDLSKPGSEALRVSDFNLVDLAGSESLKVANTTGIRLREGGKINQSLLSLSTVIQQLSLPEKKRPKHINYRDSKLTRILQPHLSGNAEMAIVCCGTPSKAFVEESRSTFRFGARAKLVALTPKVNEVQDEAALVKKLQRELAAAKRRIAELEEELREFKGETASLDGDGDNGSFSSGPDLKQEQTPYGSQQKPKYGYDEPNPVSNKYKNTSSVNSEPSTEDPVNFEDIDYGYVDMDDLPQQRQNFIPSGDEGIPAVELVDEEEEEAPKRPQGRAYVMPANQDIPLEMGLEFGGPVKPPQAAPRQYVMPKTQEVPEELERDYGAAATANRQYVMPANQDVPEDMERDYGFDPNASANFKLDEVDPDKAEKTLQKYMRGGDSGSEGEPFANDSDGSGSSRRGMSALDRLNAMGGGSDSEESDEVKEFPMPGYLGKKGGDSYGTPSRHETTLPTEDESLDGPEGSYADISYKFGSVVSTPDTLRGTSAMGGQSRFGTIDSGSEHMVEDPRNKVSWDTVDLNTMQPDQVGKPLKAMQSLYVRDAPLPDMITIMRISFGANAMCLTDRLRDSEARAAFLEGKLEMADDLVEAVFKDLERARLCIHDMVYRNVQLAAKLKEKQREDMKEEYEKGEVVVEQYWLLKGCMYTGLFFFVAGGGEFFMATVFFVWLVLEANLTV